ncbi:hypothetical protein FACS1894158_03260 [Betaproteobacteria bacterium]|nr:hypothetical protein FACS1894158_03260 [Betaproteobacteria bacterium]
MSGEKHVRLRESEYWHLMNSANQVRDLQRNNANVERELRKAQTAIEQQRRSAQDRERAFSRQVDTLSDELRASAREFQQKLHTQQQAFSRLEARQDRQEAAFRELAADTAKQFAGLARREANSEAAARQWQKDAEILIAAIRNHTRHEKFAPRKLSALQSHAALSAGNLQRGDYQAALAVAQETYTDALEVQADIAFAEAEWNAWLNEANDVAAKLLAEIETQSLVQWSIGAEDEVQQQVEMETNYWSNGDFEALRGSVAARADALRDDSAQLGVDDFKQAIADLGQESQALIAIIEQAKERQMSSIYRANIAEVLAEDLAQQGWQVVEGTWQGSAEDGRGEALRNGSYHTKLQDVTGNGNEIITIVEPTQGLDGKTRNSVRFAYFAKNNNDTHFAAEQTRQLNARLSELGIAEGSLQCVSGHETTHRGDEARRDFKAVSKQKPAPASNARPGTQAKRSLN